MIVAVGGGLPGPGYTFIADESVGADVWRALTSQVRAHTHTFTCMHANLRVLARLGLAAAGSWVGHGAAVRCTATSLDASPFIPQRPL